MSGALLRVLNTAIKYHSQHPGVSTLDHPAASAEEHKSVRERGILCHPHGLHMNVPQTLGVFHMALDTCVWATGSSQESLRFDP